MNDVAQALADPIRRDILRLVRSRPTTAGAIASAFAVSRPAVSRHLRVLRVAGLVQDEVRGREREYRLVLAPLDELVAFIEDLRANVSGWERRFLALETEVHRVRKRRQPGPRASAASKTSTKKETA